MSEKKYYGRKGEIMLYNAKAFGEAFSSLRKRRGFSIEKLAAVSSISTRTLQHIEHGTHIAKIETLKILSNYLHTNLLELLMICKDDRELEFSNILQDFLNELRHSRYHNIPTYIDALLALYGSVRYDKSSIDDMMFFNDIETAIFWLRGVNASTNIDDFQRSEIYLVTALSIRHDNLELSNITSRQFNKLELNIVNSIVVNRMRHHIYSRCYDLLEAAILQAETYRTFDTTLWLTLQCSLANYYLNLKEYAKALTVIAKAKMICSSTEEFHNICHFLYIETVCQYHLSAANPKEALEDAFTMFRLNGESHLIPILKKQLIEDHHMNLK